MSANSSNSDNENHEKYKQFPAYQTFKTKKNKDYVCPCGRSYGSYPALYSHIKQKHNGNAPGQVIKPKPHRRRGRPYKYQPVNLQYQNTHRNASRHLEDYIRVPINDQFNQFPLKDFANQDPSKINFINNTDEEQYIRYQYFMRNNNRQNPTMWMKEDEKVQQVNQFQKQSNAPFMGQHLLGENQYSFVGNQQSFDVGQMHFDQRRNQYKPPFNNQTARNMNMSMRNPNMIGIGNEGVLNSNEMNHYLRLGEQERSRRIPFQQQDCVDNFFDSIYSKPYELELKQEMQDKFNPIAHGISQFLQPILRELIVNQQQLANANRENAQVDKQVIKGKQVVIEIIEDSNDEREQQCGNNTNVNANITTTTMNDKVGGDTREMNRQQEVNHNNNNGVQRRQIDCRELLQNDHLKDIVRWMMCPPEELAGTMCKENYIENSFRCCLVQFLDFTNQFLQRIQYQQILLVLVFFCDHILALTASFQNRPQPLAYQMFMYFNSFLSQYLPKLIAFMPPLQKLFIFTDYKKNISQLFMWISTWQSIQQYYHNRCFRERILHELQQESLKSLQYQEKYNMYINQAQRQSVYSEAIINNNGNNSNIYPLQQQQFVNQYQHHQQQQQQLPQQKTEQNPEQMQFNTNGNLYHHQHQQSQANPFNEDPYFDNQQQPQYITTNLQDYNNYNAMNNEAPQHYQTQNGIQFAQHLELHDIDQLPQQEHNQNVQQYLVSKQLQQLQHLHDQQQQYQQQQQQPRPSKSSQQEHQQRQDVLNADVGANRAQSFNRQQ